MPIVEDPLQPESLDGLQFQGVFLNNVVPLIARLRPCVLHVEEGQQVPFGFQQGFQPFHQRFDQSFREVVRHVPAQNRVKLPGRIIQVLSEKLLRIDLHGAVFLFRLVLRVLGLTQNVLVVNSGAQFRNKGNVDGGGRTKIQDGELGFAGALQATHEFAQPDATAAGPWRIFSALGSLLLRGVRSTEPSPEVVTRGAQAPLLYLICYLKRNSGCLAPRYSSSRRSCFPNPCLSPLQPSRPWACAPQLLRLSP